MYKEGQILYHSIYGTKLVFLRKGNSQLLCRTPDLREVWFSDFEVTDSMSEGGRIDG